jgi:hypothetical protein
VAITHTHTHTRHMYVAATHTRQMYVAATHHLKHEPPRLLLSEPLLALHQLQHSLIRAQLHNDVHILLVLKHFFETHNMLVAQPLVDLDLGLKLHEQAPLRSDKLCRGV